MKLRRHSNNTGYRQIQRGQTRKQVARIAKRLGIPIGGTMEKQWLVYDERANPLDKNTDDANVLVCESTEVKALKFPARGYVWKYDVAEDGKTLINEEYVGPTRQLEKEGL